jgi:hypothetical protein
MKLSLLKTANDCLINGESYIESAGFSMPFTCIFLIYA